MERTAPGSPRRPPGVPLRVALVFLGVCFVGCGGNGDDVVVDYGFSLTGTVRDQQSLAPLADVEVAVGYPREGRETEYLPPDITGVDGQYSYSTLGPARPTTELLRFRRVGYTELVRRMSDATEETPIEYRLDVTLQSEGAPASPVRLEILDASLVSSGGRYVLLVQLRLVELAGVGGNLNSLRFIRVRSDGKVMDTLELGAQDIINQSGSNRLDARDEREETFFVFTSSGPREEERLDVILSYTDDRGNDTTSEASFNL